MEAMDAMFAGRERESATRTDWQPLLTLPLPAAPDAALLKRAFKELLNFIDWYARCDTGYELDSTDSFECTAREVDMQRAAGRLADISEHQAMIFRYYPKNVREKLREALAAKSVPTTRDLMAIDRVYKIVANENFSRKTRRSPRRYSGAFVEWLIDKISHEKNFLKKTRRGFNAMQRNKASSNDGRQTTIGNARR
jgi:hypothetical protein